jgi:hypothetical protein
MSIPLNISYLRIFVLDIISSGIPYTIFPPTKFLFFLYNPIYKLLLLKDNPEHPIPVPHCCGKHNFYI